MRHTQSHSSILALSILRLVHAASVGDYIASGSGEEASTTETSTSETSVATSIPTTQPIATALVTIYGTLFTATKLQDGEILVANTTVWPSGAASPSSASSPSITALPGGPYSNGSVSDCFSSWNRWWSASWLETYGTYVDYTTYTSYWTETYSGFNGTTESLSFPSIIDTTHTIMNGFFPIATETIHTTIVSVTESPYPARTSTGGGTITRSSASSQNNTLPTPTCTMPSYVPQCQSQYERRLDARLAPRPTPSPHCDLNAGFLQNTNIPELCVTSYGSAIDAYSEYIDAVPSPFCTQCNINLLTLLSAASIGGALCESVRQNDVSQANYYFAAEIITTQYLPFFFVGYLGGPINQVANDFNTTWTWPTSSTLGVPSCGTVKLIYWPQSATANGTNATAPRTMPTGPVTVEALGTTFTSPTLYISYSNVYAANGCSIIGTNITNTIIAIPTNSPLSSIYGATIPCDAHFRYTQEWTATAPFTVEDLNEPVPYNIFSSQPWCATYLREQGCVGTCPMTQGLKRPATPGSGLGPSTPTVTTGLTTTAAPVAQPDNEGDTGRAIPSPSDYDQGSAIGAVTTTTSNVEETPNTEGSATPAVPTPSGYNQGSAVGADPTTTHNLEGTNAGDPSELFANDPGATYAAPRTTTGGSGATSENVGGVLASVLAGGASTIANDALDPSQADPAIDILCYLLGGSNVAVVAQGGSSVTISAGAAPTFVNGQQVSAASDGSMGMGTGGGAQTVAAPFQGSARPAAVIVGSGTFSVVSQGEGSSEAVVVANGDSTITLSNGDPAMTLGGHVIGAASAGGVIIGSGSNAATISSNAQTLVAAADAGDAGAQPIVTINGQAYTQIAQSVGAIALGDSEMTLTLSTGGAAATIGSQMVSAGSSGGIVVGSGSSVTAIHPSVQTPGSATATGAQRILTVNGQQYTQISQSSGALVFGNSHSTFALSDDGAAITGGTQAVSADLSGNVVIGSSAYESGAAGISVASTTSDARIMTGSSESASLLASTSSTSTSSAGKLCVSLGTASVAYILLRIAC
ncbi:hypothetical protein LTR22_024636 [Elasticomyces elasticus]|nr:hypothetical protein LTR22_024636 [Elasticomyces elasticus]